MIRQIYLTSYLIFIFLLTASPGFAEVPDSANPHSVEGTFMGQAFCEGMRPFQGAVVNLIFYSGENRPTVIDRTVVDSEGNYTFEGTYPKGEYFSWVGKLPTVWGITLDHTKPFYRHGGEVDFGKVVFSEEECEERNP